MYKMTVHPLNRAEQHNEISAADLASSWLHKTQLSVILGWAEDPGSMMFSLGNLNKWPPHSDVFFFIINECIRRQGRWLLPSDWTYHGDA